MRTHLLALMLLCCPAVLWAQDSQEAPASESTAEQNSESEEDGPNTVDESTGDKSEKAKKTDQDQKKTSEKSADEKQSSKSDAVAAEANAQEETIIIVDDESSSEDEALVIVDDSQEGDTLIIMDDESSGDTVVVTEDKPLTNSLPKPKRSLERTWLRGELSTRMMVDTVFDNTGEDVIEWWNLARMNIDHRTSTGLKLFAESWVRWGVSAEHADPGDSFYVLNAGDPKWTADVQLREAYITWSPGDFDLKVGQRIFVWGKNEFMAGANVLNPPDLRFDVTSNLDSTKDGRAPVFALDATYWWADTGFQFVVVPFFSRTRGYLMGRDFALAPPGSPLEAQLKQALTLHPSVEDQLQDGFLGTEVPDESPLNSTLALRIKTKQWGWDFAVTAVYGWDQTPDVYLDEDLRVMLLSGQLNINNPQAAATDPAVNQAALAVQQKAAIGQELLRAVYHRKLTVAGELQGVVGPFVARLDVGFSPESTQYTSSFEALRKPSMMAAAGLEYTYGDSWYAQVTGYSNMVFDLAEGVTLSGIDKTPSEGDEVVGERAVAAMYGVSAGLRWTWVEESLEVSLGGLWNISPGDFVTNVQISYFDWEPHTFKVGAVLVDGPSGTLGRNFGANDFIYVEYAASF